MNGTFVSYARVDQAFALALRASLVERGHRVWLDVEELEPGEDWIAAVEAAIAKASSVVFVVSPESLRSTFCMRELRHALVLRKPIVALVRP